MCVCSAARGGAVGQGRGRTTGSRTPGKTYQRGGRETGTEKGFVVTSVFLPIFSSAVTKGQWSWWVDWMSWLLRCDQRSAELMGWLDELVAPLWPKVSGADGLTGWAGCSAVTKGQQSWWVDWVSWLLRCDQRSAELMGWLDELVAPLWPKVSRADGLTGWADCSAVTKGQQSWWVDWVSWLLRCDQRSEELMGWLGELVAPLWPKVRGADGLTGWAGCSAVTKGQRSWWVDWVSCHLLSLSISFYLNCFFSVKLSLIWMKLGMNYMRSRGYKVTVQVLNICITYVNQLQGAHKTLRSCFS